MSAAVILGDCRKVMAEHGPYDLVIADPPYVETSLAWDREVSGWLNTARDCIKPSGSIWVFGSMRSFIGSATAIARARLAVVQDIIWEKHNGSGVQSDRFRRVHEIAVQLRRADAPWAGVYNEVQQSEGVARPSARIKSNTPPGHIGAIGPRSYEYGDTRIMRSVILMRSMHGRAIHPTEKPSALLEILVRSSSPPQGLVGDFFAGSGACGEACIMADRRYVGCDTDPEMVEKARARLDGNLFSGTAA